jgi:hypothetical protein
MIWNYRCMVFRNQSVGKKNDVRRPFSWRHFCEFRCPVMPSNGNSVLVVSWFHYTTWVWKWCLSQKKTIFIGKMRINQGLGLPHFQTKPHWQIKTPNHCLWMFSPRKNSNMCNLRPMPMQNILHKCTAIATKQVSAYLWLFRFFMLWMFEPLTGTNDGPPAIARFKLQFLSSHITGNTDRKQEVHTWWNDNAKHRTQTDHQT